MKNKEELSVEEILTSIREVINNHHSGKSSKKQNLDDDILELTEVSDVKAENDNVTMNHSTMQSLNDFVSRVSSNIDQKNTKTENIRNASLEELVVNIIKPEISSWLRGNLPNIVRQIVQKEIEKLTARKD